MNLCSGLVRNCLGVHGEKFSVESDTSGGTFVKVGLEKERAGFGLGGRLGVNEVEGSTSIERLIWTLSTHLFLINFISLLILLVFLAGLL